MTRSAALLVTALLSGCLLLESEPSPTPNGGAASLLEYARFTSHVHDGERTHESRLVAPAGSTRPASCVALRDHYVHANDTCEVRGADKYHEAARDAAWTLVVVYKIRQEHVQPRNFTALGRDAGGETVAAWSGASHPKLAYATE
ncbi:MAG: hypothetical protein HYT80_00395 [Euryarchaeota archaeon]|nr:hypothetical protein [Euryarchaeota archaeon]